IGSRTTQEGEADARTDHGPGPGGVRPVAARRLRHPRGDAGPGRPLARALYVNSLRDQEGLTLCGAEARHARVGAGHPRQRRWSGPPTSSGAMGRMRTLTQGHALGWWPMLGPPPGAGLVEP